MINSRTEFEDIQGTVPRIHCGSGRRASGQLKQPRRAVQVTLADLDESIVVGKQLSSAFCRRRRLHV